MNTMLSNLDYALISLYFLVLIIIGYVSSRKQKDEDFLIAERKLGVWSTMATVNASKTGSILMIFVALVYVWGFSALWYFIGMIVGMAVFIPFSLRLKEKSNRYYTLAHYFRYNYGKTPAVFASVITIFIMVGFLVMNLIAGTKIFAFFTGWSFWICSIIMILVVIIYLWMGGFKAVVKTDFIQYISMVFIIIILSIALFNGSLVSGIDWNFFNASIGTMTGFFIVGLLFPFAMPDMWQRVYSARNKDTLKKGLILSILVYALFAFLLALVAVIIKARFPGIDPDIALIYGFEQLLPSGLLGLAVVLLFGAVMSSIDTYIFTAASVIVQDFYKLNKKNTVRKIRQIILILAFIGTLLSIVIQDLIISAYIFVSVIIVLAIPVISTWIRNKIQPLTLTFGFLFGITSVAILLFLYTFFLGSIQPVIAVIALIITVIGLLVGGFVGHVQKSS